MFYWWLIKRAHPLKGTSTSFFCLGKKKDLHPVKWWNHIFIHSAWKITKTINQLINGLISLCSSRTQWIILVRINVVYIILCRLVNKYHLNTNQLSHMWFRSDMGTLLHSVNQVWRGTILTIIPPTTQTRTILISNSSVQTTSLCALSASHHIHIWQKLQRRQAAQQWDKHQWSKQK